MLILLVALPRLASPRLASPRRVVSCRVVLCCIGILTQLTYVRQHTNHDY